VICGVHFEHAVVVLVRNQNVAGSIEIILSVSRESAPTSAAAPTQILTCEKVMTVLLFDAAADPANEVQV